MAWGTLYLSCMERRGPSILAVLGHACLAIAGVSLALVAAEVALRITGSVSTDAAEERPLDPKLE